MRVKINAEGAELEGSAEEINAVGEGALGEGEAMGIGIGVPDPQKVATEASIPKEEKSIVGEPGDREAGIAGVLVRRAFKALGKHTVEPVDGGLTNDVVRMQHDPNIQAARGSEEVAQAAPETVDYNMIAEGVRDAEVGNYNDNESYIMNFNTLNDDETRGMIGFLSTRNDENIDAQRRGVMADEALYEMAEILRSDPEFIKETMEMATGTALAPEKMLAMKQNMLLLLNDIHKLATEYPTAGEEGRRKFDHYMKTFDKLYGNLKGASAETGRALRVHGIDPGIEQGDMRPDQLSAILQQESHGLTPEMIARHISMADNARGVSGVIDSARPNIMTKTFDTAYEVFINSILSGVTTHIVNFSGSAIRTGVNVVDTAVAGLIGRGPANPSESIARGEFKAQLFGLTTGWREAFNVSTGVMKTAQKYGDVDKLDSVMHEGFIKAETYGMDPEGLGGKSVDWLGTIVRAPTERLMGGTDAFNKYMAERMSLSGQAYSKAVGMQKEMGLNEEQTIILLQEIIANPTEEMKIIAKQDGKMMTFQEELGGGLKKMQQGIQGNRFAKTIIPFFKTPMNLMRQAFVDRSPLGLASQAVRDDIAAGGRRRQMAISKIVTGTMAGSVMTMAAIDGKITGHYSKDKDLRQAQMNAGWQPMSFVINNDDGTTTYASFDRVEPFSYILGMAADLGTISREMELRDISDSEEELYGKLVTAFIVAVGENTMNKSFMTGLRSVMEAVTVGDYKAEMWAKNITNAFTPYSGMRRNAANLIDSTRRRPDGLMNHWLEQVMFWDQNAAPIIDVQGRTIDKKHLIVPWDPTKLTTNDLDLELLRIAEFTGTSAVKSIARKINGVTLTPTQQARWAVYSRKELGGDENFPAVTTELINSDGYKGAFIDIQIEMLREISKKFDDAGKAWMLQNDNDLLTRVQTVKMAPVARQVADTTGEEPSDVLNRLMDR